MTRTEIDCGDLVILPDLRTALLKDTLVHLTAKEFDLIEILAANRNQVLRRELLASFLYSDGERPRSNSIDVLIGRLRRKFKDSNVDIATVRSIGFILRRSGASKE